MEIEILTFCSPSSNFQDKTHNIKDELFSGKNSIFKATGNKKYLNTDFFI